MLMNHLPDFVIQHLFTFLDIDGLLSMSPVDRMMFKHTEMAIKTIMHTIKSNYTHLFANLNLETRQSRNTLARCCNQHRIFLLGNLMAQHMC